MASRSEGTWVGTKRRVTNKRKPKKAGRGTGRVGNRESAYLKRKGRSKTISGPNGLKQEAEVATVRGKRSETWARGAVQSGAEGEKERKNTQDPAGD